MSPIALLWRILACSALLLSLSGSTGAQAQTPPPCPCSIWSSSTTPTTASATDTAAYELGVKFKSDISGYISGIRFYKGTANTGTHVGNLWTSSGTLLASATFTGETASGWQQVTFPAAVAITANTVYVASYLDPNGGYAADSNFFANTGVDNAPLHALSNAAGGGNGVFAPGATSAFPNQTYNAANYWVDVVFTTTAPPPPPPTITNVAANAGTTSATITWSTNVPTTSQVNYGTTTSYGSSTTLDSTLVTSHSQTLTGLTASTLYHFQVQSKNASGTLVSSPDATFTTTAASGTCPCSIWSSSTTPTTASATDTAAYELGVKFKSDISGYISGIRFYKGTANTGTHLGNLWTSSGTRLAGATFTGETASGWQQVTFPAAVAITANTVYVASYLDPNGGYATDPNFFANTGVDNAPLHALSNAAGGGNGVFTPSTSTTFPDQSYNATNYWVDVVFTITAPPPGNAPNISGVTVPNASGSTATITWTTDVASDSQVEYGPTTAYGSSSAIDPTMVFSHSVTLSGLTPGATYHFRVKSKPNGGTLATSGDSTLVVADPSISGQWSADANWPLVAVHSTLLNTGKVLMWDAWDTGGTASVRLWDPIAQTFTSAPDPYDQIFCSGHVLLPDGRLLEVGGHNGSEKGVPAANIFDPSSSTWSRGTPMNFARWYPSATELGDGRVVVLSGTIQAGSFADTPEVFSPTTNTWSTLPIWTSGVHEENYPLGFVLPNGKMLVIAQTTGQSYLLDVDAHSWTNANLGVAPSLFGSAVMYRPGQFLYTGGGPSGGPSQTTTSVLDMTQSSPAWRQTAAMNFPRYDHNTVILADGTVLAVGGSRNVDQGQTRSSTLPAEIWDPTSQTWTVMASEHDPRMYHSTALLLPDGRVLSAGGGRLPGVAGIQDYPTAEVFSPPYLFKGARPVITSAPGTTTYGATVTVQTPDAASISSVALVGLGSVTHTYDMNQRYVPLTFTAGAGSLSVQIPTSSNVAPPGFYMLFLLNSNGVPSIASTMQLAATPPTTAPIISAVAATNINGAAATINWSTNRITDGQVEYGTTSSYGSSTAINSGLTTNHSLGLTNLAANTTYHFRVKSTDSAGNVAVSTDSTLTTSAAPVCPCSIWSATDTPSVTGQNDGQAIEVGVKFRSDLDGYINGVRFFKTATNTGSHVGNLWTTSGTLLASATFSGETASGWQEVDFATPVRITANTTYVASYYSPGGGYAGTALAFTTTGVDRSPMHALSNGDAAGNGVYRYGASGIPNQTFNASNYWVDAVYTKTGALSPAASGPPPTAMSDGLTAASLSTSSSWRSPIGATVAWSPAGGEAGIGSPPTTLFQAQRLAVAEGAGSAPQQLFLCPLQGRGVSQAANLGSAVVERKGATDWDSRVTRPWLTPGDEKLNPSPVPDPWELGQAALRVSSWPAVAVSGARYAAPERPASTTTRDPRELDSLRMQRPTLVRRV